MKQLYAPWRGEYTRKAHKQGIKKSGACVFCAHKATPAQDEQNFILKRLKHSFIMLNLFPYNAGHLLVVPYEHVNTLSQLSPEARQELMEATTQAVDALEKAFKPDGFNIGMNLGGKSAGGSIPDHAHMHVLPRFFGDTNFLVTLAHTKVIDLSLNDIYQQLKNFFIN